MQYLNRHVCVVAALFALCSATGNAAAVPGNVSQNAQGNCNQNNTIVYVTLPSSGRSPVVMSSPKVTTGAVCPRYDGKKKPSALEDAQLKVLIAENPTNVAARPLRFYVRLGERLPSLWLDLKNPSKLDAHELRVDIGTERATDLKVKKVQTYLTPSLPDSVLSSKNVVLKSDTTAALLVASPEEIREALGERFADWCLYDVGSRARDQDSEGYDLATRGYMQSILHVDDSRLTASSTASIAMLVNVSYTDVFDVQHLFAVQAFLRAAAPGSGYVFYPSRRTYDLPVCLNH